MSDYRVDVRLRNNRILSLIERAGYSSVLSFCRSKGLAYQEVVRLVGIKNPALRSNGSYRDIVHRLADALACDPEDLFTERQARAEMTPRASRVLGEREALSLSMSEPEALAIADNRNMDTDIDRRKLVVECLGKLSPRERRIIERRWLVADDKLADLAVDGGVNGGQVSRGLMHMMEQRAMQKMREHLQRAHQLNSVEELAS